MTTSLKRNYQNDSKKDVIVFIVFIGFIVFAIYIFNHYNGAKYIQDTWNSWFAVQNKTGLLENKLSPEKKTNAVNCPYTFRYYSQKTEKFVDECTICPKVWSVSQNKFIYECKTKDEFKSQTLSDCSKNFRENLDQKVLSSLKNVTDLEKFRDLSIKMCMQEAGFDY